MEKKLDTKTTKAIDDRLYQLQQSLDMNYGAYSRLLFAVQQVQETTALKFQSLSAKMDELEKKIDYIHAFLPKELSERFDTLDRGISNMEVVLNQLDRSQDQLSPLPELVRNIDYNIRVNGGGGSDKKYIEELQKRVSEYQEDAYLKFLRQYILDSLVSLYTNISFQVYENAQTTQLQNILKIIENDLGKMGIKLHSSNPMQQFDPKHMDICEGQTEYTDDEKIENLVYCSIVPEFIWTLPAIGHQQQMMTLKKEVVVLYSLSLNR